MVGASQSPLAQRLGEETPVDSCAHSAATGGLRYSGEMCTITELLCWCMIYAESAIQCTFYLDLIELSFESRGEKGRAVVELELYREICQAFFFGVGLRLPFVFGLLADAKNIYLRLFHSFRCASSPTYHAGVFNISFDVFVAWSPSRI